jgi:hypothetical protein
METENEITMTLFPTFFVPILLDKDFYEALFILLKKQIDTRLNFCIASIFTKISTSRTSILDDPNIENTKEIFKNYIVHGFFVVFDNCPKTNEFLELLLDYLLRLHVFFGYNYMLKTEKLQVLFEKYIIDLT